MIQNEKTFLLLLGALDQRHPLTILSVLNYS